MLVCTGFVIFRVDNLVYAIITILKGTYIVRISTNL